MGHPFLSEDWFSAVKALEAPEPPALMQGLIVNMEVTDGPDGDIRIHLDSGRFEPGHVEGAPTTVSVPYQVAKQMFVDQDQAAAMQAFMSGKIRVTGDMTKLMALQTVQPTAEQQTFQAKIIELTA
ncbi:MAG TPA: SCP2 sterol-binding domain-containing protein [Acidimicrobiales bacterium]|nr:SCP2 sterol-binding domain-containing protein [Acidimicrobiales bacterium]